MVNVLIFINPSIVNNEGSKIKMSTFTIGGHCTLAVLNGPSPASFRFLIVLFKKFYRIKTVLLRDSNSDRQR